MKFRCWCPGEGQTRAGAVDIDATTAKEAAEAFAKKWYQRRDHTCTTCGGFVNG